MARQISLIDTVRDAQADAPERVIDIGAGADRVPLDAEKTAPKVRKRTQSPRKTGAAKNASKPAPAPKDTKTAPTPAAGAGEPQELPRRTQPRIRGVKTGDAVRLNIYLHPDDAEWLRTEGPRGSTQNVFRAMIAVMRHNQQVAKQVNKLSADGRRGEW